MIGQHQGLMYHTLGQRKGLHIGGTKGGGGNSNHGLLVKRILSVTF
ncbi:hypothetical protein O9992_15875 [Vibrio lentus]|nr:hypothetical protein [Vibrio lentus]